MIGHVLKHFLSDNQKLAVKRFLARWRGRYVRVVHGYDSADLRGALESLGICHGDTVMAHANFPPDTGFTGNPAVMVDTLVDAVGDSGNFMMVSIPFRGSAADYLEKEAIFDVTRTISMMGLVSEVFRRRPGTLRSLHPTHPVTVVGRDAADIIANHSMCDYPCGQDSPFDELRKLNGKLLFVDVSFGAMTFFHYLEDLYKDELPIPVYEENPYVVSVRDSAGELGTVCTYAFRRNVDRDTSLLERELVRRKAIRRRSLGRTSLMVVACADVVDAMTALIARQDYPVRMRV